MGKRAAMNATLKTPLSRQSAKKLTFRDNFDLPLLLIVVCLFAIGLLMVYSASWQYARFQGYSEYGTVLRQFVIGILGMVAMFVITQIDYHRYRRWVVCESEVDASALTLSVSRHRIDLVISWEDKTLDASLQSQTIDLPK